MEPESYQFKRYTLMVACSILIVIYIIFAANAPTYVDEYIETLNPHKRQEISELERYNSIVLLRFVCGLGIVFQLTGLIGARQEHFGSVCIYTVLQILCTINQVRSGITYPIDWPIIVISPIASIVAILVVLDLRTIQNTQTISQSNI